MIGGLPSGWMPSPQPAMQESLQGTLPVSYTHLDVYKRQGYNSVVYFAAIMGIDAEMIEASRVDGANGFQKIRYIILPSLKPTIVILILFALGGIVKGLSLIHISG